MRYTVRVSLWVIAGIVVVGSIGIGATFWTTTARHRHLDALVTVSARECHRLHLRHEAWDDNPAPVMLGVRLCVRNANTLEDYRLSAISADEGTVHGTLGGGKEDPRLIPLAVKLLGDGGDVTLKRAVGTVVSSEVTLYPKPGVTWESEDPGFLASLWRLEISGYWIEKHLEVQCGSVMEEEEWRSIVLTGGGCVN